MDRETVIKGLEDIQKHLDIGYSFAICWKSELIRDALALLKEQEAEIRQLKLALDIAKGTCNGIKMEGR